MGIFSINLDNETPEDIKEIRDDVEREMKENKKLSQQETKEIKVQQEGTADQELRQGAAEGFRSRTPKQNRERFSASPHQPDMAGQDCVGPQNFIEGLGINPEEEFTPEALEAYGKLSYNFDHPEFKPDKPDSFRFTFPQENKPAARVKLEEAVKNEFGVDSVDKLTVEQAEQLFNLDLDKLDIAKKLQIKDKGKELGLDSFGEDGYLKQVRDFYSQKKALDAYNAERDKNLDIVWKEAEPICENHVRSILGLGPNDPVQAQETQPQPEPVAQTEQQEPAEQTQPTPVATPVQSTEGNEATGTTEPVAGPSQTVETNEPQAFNPAAGFQMSSEAEARLRDNNKGATLLSIMEAFASAKTPEDAFQNALIAAILYLPNKVAWGLEYAEERAKEKNAYIEANLREHVKQAQEAAKERAAQEKERAAEEEKLRIAGLEAENRYDDAVATAKGLNATDCMRSVHADLFEAMGDMEVLAANIHEKNPKLLEGLNFEFKDDGTIKGGDLDKLRERVLAEGYFNTYGHQISEDKLKQVMEQSKALLSSGAYAETGKEMADERAAEEYVNTTAEEQKDADEFNAALAEQDKIDTQAAEEYVNTTAEEQKDAAEFNTVLEEQNKIDAQKTIEAQAQAQAQAVEPPPVNTEPLQAATSEDKENVVEEVTLAAAQTEQRKNDNPKPHKEMSLRDSFKALKERVEGLKLELNSCLKEMEAYSKNALSVELNGERVKQARVIATSGKPGQTILREQHALA